MDPTHSSRWPSLYFIDIATSLHVFYARASRSDKAYLLRTINLQNLIALTRCLLMPDFSPEWFQVYCLFFAIKSGEERAIPYTARLIGQRTSFLSPQHQWQLSWKAHFDIKHIPTGCTRYEQIFCQIRSLAFSFSLPSPSPSFSFPFFFLSLSFLIFSPPPGISTQNFQRSKTAVSKIWA